MFRCRRNRLAVQPGVDDRRGSLRRDRLEQRTLVPVELVALAHVHAEDALAAALIRQRRAQAADDPLASSLGGVQGAGVGAELRDVDRPPLLDDLAVDAALGDEDAPLVEVLRREACNGLDDQLGLVGVQQADGAGLGPEKLQDGPGNEVEDVLEVAPAGEFRCQAVQGGQLGDARSQELLAVPPPGDDDGHQPQQPQRPRRGRVGLGGGRRLSVRRPDDDPPQQLTLQEDGHVGAGHRAARIDEAARLAVGGLRARALPPDGRGPGQRLALPRADAKGDPQDRDELVLNPLE